MKKIIYFLTICSTLLLVSCNEDFLDRTPLDEISEPEFWKTTSDLELYANSFYNKLPGWSGSGFGSAQMPDVGTDLGLGLSAPSRLQGTQGIPNSGSASLWSWDEVRLVNYFVSNVSKAEGLEVEINQFTGECYFFRAYFYYDLLKKYGDLPIYDAYFVERSKIMDERLEMYKMIDEKYGSMSDDDAAKIADAFFTIEKKLSELEKSTYEKIQDGLSSLRGIQFLQIQRQIDTVLKLQISAQFPLLK